MTGGVKMIKCKLKVLLAEHDMTQKDLADNTGIRKPTISDMCNNKTKHIPVDTLNKLCEYFNCDVQDIYRYEKNN